MTGTPLSNAELMAALRVDRKTLYNWRAAGMPHHTHKRKVTYCRKRVAEWHGMTWAALRAHYRKISATRRN